MDKPADTTNGNGMRVIPIKWKLQKLGDSITRFDSCVRFGSFIMSIGDYWCSLTQKKHGARLESWVVRTLNHISAENAQSEDIQTIGFVSTRIFFDFSEILKSFWLVLDRHIGLFYVFVQENITCAIREMAGILNICG